MEKLYEEQTASEKAFYIYTSALERGNLDIVQTVLAQAEQNPTLEQMILDLNELYAQEADQERAEDKAVQVVQNLAAIHLLSATPFVPRAEASEAEIPPLRISDVLARMQSEAAAQGRSTKEVEVIIWQLRDQPGLALPQVLSKNAISRLFQQLGLSTSPFIQKAFRDKAIEMSMGREQHEAQLAAARRQKQSKKPEARSDGDK